MNELRHIRDLTDEDIVSLQVIDEQQHGQAWSQRMFIDEIELTNRVHLVAETSHQVIGHAAAWIDGACCRVTNVAVDADHAGHGHGSALLLNLLQTVLNQHRVANVQLEVRPTNRRAQRLYGRFGFMPVGVERGFYDKGDALGSRDAVIMAVPDTCAEPWRQRIEQLANDLAASDANGAAA